MEGGGNARQHAVNDVQMKGGGNARQHAVNDVQMKGGGNAVGGARGATQ